jgi:hypothetical protein
LRRPACGTLYCGVSGSPKHQHTILVSCFDMWCKYVQPEKLSRAPFTCDFCQLKFKCAQFGHKTHSLNVIEKRRHHFQAEFIYIPTGRTRDSLYLFSEQIKVKRSSAESRHQPPTIEHAERTLHTKACTYETAKCIACKCRADVCCCMRCTSFNCDSHLHFDRQCFILYKSAAAAFGFSKAHTLRHREMLLLIIN